MSNPPNPNPSPSQSTDPNIKTLLIGLSGPSSSGKTTLARLLRSIFNVPSSPSPSTHSPSTSPSLSLFIIHQDDFYLTDTQIPLITTPANSPSGLPPRELQDWDCVEAIDLPLFVKTLRYVKEHGELPADSVSKEDLNDVGESGVGEEVIERYQTRVRAWFGGLKSTGSKSSGEAGVATDDAPTTTTELRICILDGFLLYPNPRADSHPDLIASSTSTILTTPIPSTPNTTNPQPQPQAQPNLHDVADLLSPKLFLPSSRSKTLSRRLNRSGYVTLEGFWADPPGYVEDVVWPNYIRDCGWMLRSRTGAAGEEREVGNGKVLGHDQTGNRDDMNEGIVNEEKAKAGGIVVAPGMGELGMSELLAWGVEVVMKAVEEQLIVPEANHGRSSG